jgi:phospholipase/carboxylesterase
MFNRIRNRLPVPHSLAGQTSDALDVELPAELQELYHEWSQTGGAAALNESAAAESDWPVSIFVPERYEERYAYPLVIWFHGEGKDEDQLEGVMHAVSPQNYIGLGLRGNHECLHGGYRWNMGSLKFGALPLLDLLHVTACRMRRAFHIHSERIFVGGCDFGASVALQVLAERPDWFAGGVLLNPCWSPADPTAEHLQNLRGMPILQAVSRCATDQNLARNVETVRLLRSAGVRLTVELFDRVPDVESGDVRFVDHWLMHQLQKTSLV